MKNNFLIFNSSPDKLNSLAIFFGELSRREHSLFLFTNKNNNFSKYFQTNKWPTKKIFLGPSPEGPFARLLFLTLLPLLISTSFFALAFTKRKKTQDFLVCANANEKIISAFLAKLLPLKIIWLEIPPEKERKYFFSSFFSFCAKMSNALVVNIGTKNIPPRENENSATKNFFLGANLKNGNFQNNIFNELANRQKDSAAKRFFTFGLVADLNKKQNLEPLFQAFKIFLLVIPRSQLVIIGDGDERKNLLWLAKKMEIENSVWLVGKQDHLKKWLDNFDIFLFNGKTINLDDMETIFRTMAAQLPVIGSANIGLETILSIDNLEYLTDINNAETLAQTMIKLQKNKQTLKKIGAKNREKLEKSFDMEKNATEFEKILLSLR